MGADEQQTESMVLQPSSMEEDCKGEEYNHHSHHSITRNAVLFRCSPAWCASVGNLPQHWNQCIRHPLPLPGHSISRCCGKLLLHHSLLSRLLSRSWRNGLSSIHHSECHPSRLLSSRGSRRCRRVIAHSQSQEPHFDKAQGLCPSGDSRGNFHRSHVHLHLIVHYRYSFGENNIWRIHDEDQPLYWLNRFTKSVFGIRIPPLRSIIPHNTQITTVFGSPIPVTKCACPSEEEVNRVHDEVAMGDVISSRLWSKSSFCFARTSQWMKKIWYCRCSIGIVCSSRNEQ